MAREDVFTVNSNQSEEAVFKALEDSLTQLGQCTITKKGIITINPRSKYSNMMAQLDVIEGTIRKKRDGQFDVTVNYKINATITCWVLAFVFGLSIGIGFLLLLIPYYTKPNQVKKDVAGAVHRAELDVEG